MADEKQPPSEAPQLEQQPGLDDELGRHLATVSAAVQNIMGPLPEHAQWNEIVALHKSPAACIKAGRDSGIPPEYISRCAFEFMAENVRGQHYRVVAKFMANMGFGTADQIIYFEDLATAQEAEVTAAQARDAEKMQNFRIELYADATMADLFGIMEYIPRPEYRYLIDKITEDLGDYYDFFTDLWQDLDAAAGVRVIDFFAEYLAVDPDYPDELPLPVTWITKAAWDAKKKQT